MPLVIRQPETPSAIRKRTAVLLIRLLRFAQEKKLSVTQPTTMAAMIRRKTIGLPDTTFHAFLPKLISFLFSMPVPPIYSNCVARAMMFSCVASLPSMKPVTRPSHMTMMRSDMPISSPISELIIMMLLPLRASSSMMQ